MLQVRIRVAAGVYIGSGVFYSPRDILTAEKFKSSCLLCSFRHNMEMTALSSTKPVVWIGSTRADLASFPEDAKDAVGYALYIAQRGGKHGDAKPLRGFGGAGILEIVENHAGDTYRAVYTVRLTGRIYVLHVFQKKSKAGIKTPKPEVELIKSRLKRAEEEHARWLEVQKG